MVASPTPASCKVLAVIRGAGVQDVGLVAEPETINR